MVVFLKFEDNTQRPIILAILPSLPYPCPSFCPLREIEFNVKNVRFLGNPVCSLIKYINVFQVMYSKFNNYKKMRITKLFKITIAWVPGGHRGGKALPLA